VLDRVAVAGGKRVPGRPAINTLVGVPVGAGMLLRSERSPASSVCNPGADYVAKVRGVPLRVAIAAPVHAVAHRWQDPELQPRLADTALAASAEMVRELWFDGIHDLALLRVPLLRGAPELRLADDTRPQTPGFSLGFVGGRKTIKRARLGVTSSHVSLPTLELENRAGVSLTMKERLVTVIRGISGPGGSGGPIIDRHGRVMATLFAGIPRSDIILAVPNRIVRSAMRRAGGQVRVPACGDPLLKATPRESIAARNA